MIVLTTSAAQVVPIGGAIVFDNVVFNSGCNKCRVGALTKLTTRGVHHITFTGNIGATADTTQAIVELDLSGVPIPGTQLISTTAASGNLNNVSGGSYINNCCGDYGTVTVVNRGTTTLNVGAGANLSIAKLGE